MKPHDVVGSGEFNGALVGCSVPIKEVKSHDEGILC